MLCEGEKLWWLFPCGIFLKQLGLVFAPLGSRESWVKAGSKPGKGLGERREEAGFAQDRVVTARSTLALLRAR